MRVRPVLALLLGVAAAVAIGCGGDRSSLLAGADAAGLKDELSAVRSALDDGKCSEATVAAQDFRRAAAALPTSVDPDLRANLRSGASKLFTETLNDCRDPQTIPTTTSTTTTPTTPTTTTPTTTTPTTPTTTTPTTTTPTTPTTTTPTTTPTTPGDGTGGTGPGEATP